MQPDKEYVIRLNGFDLGQMLDGLEVRARSWRDTATFLQTGVVPSLDFLAEECCDAAEALQLAEHYEHIMKRLREQRAQQDRP